MMIASYTGLTCLSGRLSSEPWAVKNPPTSDVDFPFCTVAMSFDTSHRAFPTLTESEMKCLEQLGTVRTFADGEPLFRNGDKDFSFFAVKSGHVAIIDNSSGSAREVGVHGPFAFTGDVDTLTGRPAVVSAVARGECEAVEITACRVRRMLGEVPELSDKLLEAFRLRRELLEASEFLGIRVIGSVDSPETLQIREFFYKNKVPCTFQDVADRTGQDALIELGASLDEIPIIACNEHVVKQPSLAQIAECLGISRRIPETVYDVLIVGAGPAGLAAAVYGASEGLKTLVVDGVGPGGQAGQSSRIENYMGFPSGLPGAELANRGYLQAIRFGAEFTAPVMVRSMQPHEDGGHSVEFCTGQSVRTKSVIVATGASYRRLPIENCKRLEGAGVFYAATEVEARTCRESTAIVVGGGNSAGQAAMYLSGHAKEVKLLIRGGDLRKSMSDYLAQRIENHPTVEVRLFSEIQEMEGGKRLESISIGDKRTGALESVACSGAFIFIGARPHTEWLPDAVALDKNSFVLTGPAVQHAKAWRLDRTPCELETSLPGVFAAGDVRSGTTKRCAFAAGDGALAITCVHQYLHQDD